MCLDVTGEGAPNPRAQNVEVRGTHVGLGFNPAVLAVVLDRLAQPEESWRPFRPPMALGAWYPPAATWIAPSARTRRRRRRRNIGTR